MEAVEDAGFEATLLSQGGLESLTLAVSGMSVSGDATAVEVALRRVPGVAKAAVSLLTGHAEVWYDPNTAGEGAAGWLGEGQPFMEYRVAAGGDRGWRAGRRLAGWWNVGTWGGGALAGGVGDMGHE